MLVVMWRLMLVWLVIILYMNINWLIIMFLRQKMFF